MAYRKGKMQPNHPGGTHSVGPNGSFPIGDATHDRMAISGATRSEHAGNISESTEHRIQAAARADLRRKGGLKSMHDHADELHPTHRR